MSTTTWLLFLVTAAMGAVARVVVDRWVHDRVGGSFRWGTLLVNVTGSLALGVVTGLALEHGLSSAARTVVGTGALGAYTTFGTFSAEVVHQVEEGRSGAAATYLVATATSCLLAAAAGLAATGAL